ncbi:UNVERIFIED_CONTAM: hypothetical protein Sradi_2363800 [Sesamum radiatum]|uniref:Uncharacterized protein n=1 Tax=Sesamum radiatum TaxID=300843 RepID=A0AAW2T675_SESRA
MFSKYFQELSDKERERGGSTPASRSARGTPASSTSKGKRPMSPSEGHLLRSLQEDQGWLDRDPSTSPPSLPCLRLLFPSKRKSGYLLGPSSFMGLFSRSSFTLEEQRLLPWRLHLCRG